MRLNDLGDVTSYLCVPFTIFVSCYVALPQLRGDARIYYSYLMCFSVPYVIGNICDANKIGPQWMQWHLLDVSYEPWAAVLGTTIYLCIMKTAGRSISQRSIMIATIVSLVVFTLMADAWEIGQNWLELHRHEVIDVSDYNYYVGGFMVALNPFFFSRRLRATLSAQPS